MVADNFTTGVLTNLTLPASCNNQASVFIRWVMTSNTSVSLGTVAAGGTSRIDNIILNGSAACAAPTIQASNIISAGSGPNSISVTWTNGDGSGRIVKINTVNTFTNPINGVDPPANPVYGGTGEQVVYNGSGNSVNVSGLNPATVYWFRVYEYNCSGPDILFLSTTATLNPASLSTSGTDCTPQNVTIAFQGGEGTVADNWSFTGGNVNKRFV